MEIKHKKVTTELACIYDNVEEMRSHKKELCEKFYCQVWKYEEDRLEAFYVYYQ